MNPNMEMKPLSTPFNANVTGHQPSPVACLNGQQVSPVDEDLSTYLDALECDPNKQEMRKNITTISQSFAKVSVKEQPSRKMKKEKYYTRKGPYHKRKGPYAVNKGLSCVSATKHFLCRHSKFVYFPLNVALEEWVDKSEDKEKTKTIAIKLFTDNKYVEFDGEFNIKIPDMDLESLPDLTKCSKIKSVSLYSTKIKDSFRFDFPPRLTCLDLSHAGLKSSCKIEYLLCEYVYLKILRLSANELKDIPKVLPNCALEHLSLDGNAICYSPQNEENLLGYSCLLSLNLSNNPLGCIPQCSNTLTSLILSGINLKDDSMMLALNTLEQLKELNLSCNFLTKIPEIASIKLENLNMYGNELKNENDDFSLEKFTHLDTLCLSYNSLINIPFMNNNIAMLFLNDNQLVSNASVLRLENLNNLVRLDLSDNFLTNLPFNFSTKLNILDVSENNITQYDSTKKMVSEPLHIIITGNPVVEHLSELQLLAPSSAQWENNEIQHFIKCMVRQQQELRRSQHKENK